MWAEEIPISLRDRRAILSTHGGVRWSQVTQVKTCKVVEWVHASGPKASPQFVCRETQNPRDLRRSSAELVRLVSVPFSQIMGCLNQDWVKTQSEPEGKTKHTTSKHTLNWECRHRSDIFFEPRWDSDTHWYKWPHCVCFLWVNLHLSCPSAFSWEHLSETSLYLCQRLTVRLYYTVVNHLKRCTERRHSAEVLTYIRHRNVKMSVIVKLMESFRFFLLSRSLGESVRRQGGKGGTVWIRAFIKLFNNYHNYHCISSPRCVCDLFNRTRPLT